MIRRRFPGSVPDTFEPAPPAFDILVPAAAALAPAPPALDIPAPAVPDLAALVLAVLALAVLVLAVPVPGVLPGAVLPWQLPAVFYLPPDLTYFPMLHQPALPRRHVSLRPPR